MGMGDKPKPFTPAHHRTRDDVIGREFVECAMRSCPHPKVIEKFGVGGVANVSIYTCKRCRHHEEVPFVGGIKCGYELANSIPPGTGS